MSGSRLRLRNIIAPILFSFSLLIVLGQPAGAATYSLTFINPPANAEVGAVISRVALHPDGGSVQVLLTSNGNPVNNKDVSIEIASGGPSSALTGTTPVSTDNAGGVASFGDLRITQPGNYTLRAFNRKLGVSETSGLFTIWQNVCGVDEQCPASGSGGLSVAYSASDNATVGNLTVNTGVDSLVPEDAACHAPAITTAEATPDFNGTSRTIVLTFPKTKCGAGKYEVWAGKDTPFITLGGGTSALDPTTGLYEGDLPPCSAVYQINGSSYMITPGVDPCLQSSVSRKSPVASQIETIIVPGTDIRCG